MPQKKRPNAQKVPSAVDRFIALSDAEKSAIVSRYDSGPVPAAELTDLTPAERRSWDRTQAELQAGRKPKLSRSRPVVGHATMSVQISVEKGLLADADAYAKSHGLKRTELIAHGLRLAMASGIVGSK